MTAFNVWTIMFIIDYFVGQVLSLPAIETIMFWAPHRWTLATISLLGLVFFLLGKLQCMKAEIKVLRQASESTTKTVGLQADQLVAAFSKEKQQAKELKRRGRRLGANDMRIAMLQNLNEGFAVENAVLLHQKRELTALKDKKSTEIAALLQEAAASGGEKHNLAGLLSSAHERIAVMQLLTETSSLEADTYRKAAEQQAVRGDTQDDHISALGLLLKNVSTQSSDREHDLQQRLEVSRARESTTRDEVSRLSEVVIEQKHKIGQLMVLVEDQGNMNLSMTAELNAARNANTSLTTERNEMVVCIDNLEAEVERLYRIEDYLRPVKVHLSLATTSIREQGARLRRLEPITPKTSSSTQTKKIATDAIDLEQRQQRHNQEEEDERAAPMPTCTFATQSPGLTATATSSVVQTLLESTPGPAAEKKFNLRAFVQPEETSVMDGDNISPFPGKGHLTPSNGRASTSNASSASTLVRTPSSGGRSASSASDDNGQVMDSSALAKSSSSSGKSDTTNRKTRKAKKGARRGRKGAVCLNAARMPAGSEEAMKAFNARAGAVRSAT